MPRQEEPVPWVASQAAARQSFPRKNLYFVGAGMDELFDYCIWKAHIDGHTTLDGKPARNSPMFIMDTMMRVYFEDMLKPGKFESFTAWRSAEYRAGTKLVQARRPLPLILAIRKMLRMLPKRGNFAGTLNEWELSSKEYRDLSRFCDLFNERVGPLFEEEKQQKRKKAS